MSTGIWGSFLAGMAQTPIHSQMRSCIQTIMWLPRWPWFNSIPTNKNAGKQQRGKLSGRRLVECVLVCVCVCVRSVTVGQWKGLKGPWRLSGCCAEVIKRTQRDGCLMSVYRPFLSEFDWGLIAINSPTQPPGALWHRLIDSVFKLKCGCIEF